MAARLIEGALHCKERARCTGQDVDLSCLRVEAHYHHGMGPARHVVDGGELGCGELLLSLVRGIAGLPAGTEVRVVASDPAAPIDIPVWCHLTGHGYRGRSTHLGRSCYDIELLYEPRPRNQVKDSAAAS